MRPAERFLRALPSYVSAIIKLWTSDPESNTTLAQLERAYFAALDSADRMEERGRINAASGKFTPEGIKADAQQFALKDLLPGLDRARELISTAKTELSQRKAKLKVQQSNQFDASPSDLHADIGEFERALRPRNQRWKRPSRRCELRQAC